MRQFLKFMLASMLGTLLIGVVLIILLIGGLAALGSSFSMEAKPSTIKDGSVLMVDLSPQVLDRGEKDPMNLNFGPFKFTSRLGLNDILASIEKAKHDDRIKGVFLDLGLVNAGLTTVKEIRDKLQEFKQESAKPVVAFADMYTQKSYYLASVADRVWIARAASAMQRSVARCPRVEAPT